MTAQDLKNSILQLAVQGKLVPQDPSDEPASELLQRVYEEKAAALKAGVIKKDKKIVPLAEEDIPYDIPSTWCWMRLGELCQLLDGEKYSGVKYPYLEAKYLRGKISATFLDGGKFVKKGTRLILVDGENSGEVFFATEDGYMGSTFKVLYMPNSVYEPYILSFLLLKKQLFRNSKTGAAIPHLNKELFFTLPVPIPPYAEQERIVAKIEELLPLVDGYGEAEERLKVLNAEFPEKLRKSILQQAVQGKLTERDPADESASELLKRIRTEKAKLIAEGKIKKEKPLPPITDEEKPFDIPDTWEWVRLSDVIDVRDGTHDTPKYITSGYPLITGKDFYNGYFQLDKTQYISEADYLEIIKRSKVDIGDILFSMIGGNIGSMIRITTDNYFEMGIKNVALFKQYMENETLSCYLFYFLKSQIERMRKSAKGGAQPFVPLNLLRLYPFPLPPLEEQKRIVARVEELLAVCDGLK